LPFWENRRPKTSDYFAQKAA